MDLCLSPLVGLVCTGKSEKALPPQAGPGLRRAGGTASRAQVQMARELGLNPGKLGKLSNHGQEPWKAPLPQFIEHLYLKRFGREQPRVVTPAENWGRSAAGNPARNALATNARSDQAGQGSP